MQKLKKLVRYSDPDPKKETLFIWPEGVFTGFTYNEISQLGQDTLGKGIVHAKDTPNFIGNRIGVYGMAVTMNTAIEHGLTVEEVDKLGKQLATVQGTYDNVHARLATGRGNLVRQVETIKGLGANTKKTIATSLLENSQDDE